MFIADIFVYEKKNRKQKTQAEQIKQDTLPTN